MLRVDLMWSNWIYFVVTLPYFQFTFQLESLISLGNFQEAKQTIIAFKYGKKTTLPQGERRQFVFVRDLIDEVMNGSDSWNQTVQKPKRVDSKQTDTNCNFLHVFQLSADLSRRYLIIATITATKYITYQQKKRTSHHPFLLTEPKGVFISWENSAHFPTKAQIRKQHLYTHCYHPTRNQSTESNQR